MNNSVFSSLMAFIIDKAPTVIPFSRRSFDKARWVDFLAPLALRLYLAPVLWMAGTRKFTHFSETAEWFGSVDAGLGLPMPYVLVFLVALIETVGALFLLFGFATRLMSLPLMVIMAVAAVTAHLKNGWLAIAAGSGLFATDRTAGAMERLERAREILQSQGDYAWLTENGDFAVLNNGVEFAATYFVMFLTLFFIGGGRYVSADYWLVRRYFND
ncbi:MAG: HvfX family Cu-binding RiPP maturation protein [Methylomonas sp.]